MIERLRAMDARRIWPVPIGALCAISIGIGVLLLAQISDAARELFAVHAQQVVLDRSEVSLPSPPPTLSKLRPFVRTSGSRARTTISERLNVLLREVGLSVQQVSIERRRDFGSGLTGYDVSVVGRGSTDGIDAAMQWLSHNGGALVLQTLSISPTTSDAAAEADVHLGLLVLVEEAAP